MRSPYLGSCSSDFATRELYEVVLRRIVNCRKSVVERGQTRIAPQRVATRACGIALRLAFHMLARGPEFEIPPLPHAHVLKLWDVSASATISRKVSFQMLLIKRKSLYDYTENHKHWLMIFLPATRIVIVQVVWWLRMPLMTARSRQGLSCLARYLGIYCSIRATVRLRHEPRLSQGKTSIHVR